MLSALILGIVFTVLSWQIFFEEYATDKNGARLGTFPMQCSYCIRHVAEGLPLPIINTESYGIGNSVTLETNTVLPERSASLLSQVEPDAAIYDILFYFFAIGVVLFIVNLVAIYQQKSGPVGELKASGADKTVSAIFLIINLYISAVLLIKSVPMLGIIYALLTSLLFINTVFFTRTKRKIMRCLILNGSLVSLIVLIIAIVIIKSKFAF